MSKKQLYSSFTLLLLLIGILSLSLIFFHTYEQEMRVTFIDVGEGDAILFSQGSNQILIDSGRSGKELLAHLGRHIPFFDRTIETVIVTHPDADHIGGFSDLIRAYAVGQFLFTGAEGTTDVFSLLRKDLEENNIAKQKIFEGSTITLPNGGEMKVLFPHSELPSEMKETNRGSLVIQFLYGETEMLLTGDLPSEETVLSNISHIDILKVSHHGSRYSTSDNFLDQIVPREAVISVGKNSYGHPNADVLHRLEVRGVLIHRTDEDGDIEYICTQAQKKCVFVE